MFCFLYFILWERVGEWERYDTLVIDTFKNKKISNIYLCNLPVFICNKYDFFWRFVLWYTVHNLIIHFYPNSNITNKKRTALSFITFTVEIIFFNSRLRPHLKRTPQLKHNKLTLPGYTLFLGVYLANTLLLTNKIL